MQAGVTNCLYMAVIGSAAAADYTQVGMAVSKRAVRAPQINGIAFIEGLGLI